MAAVTALWEAAGRPPPNWQGKARSVRTVPEPRWGVCALTGQRGAVWDARHVISDQFTAYDRFRHRDTDPAGLAFGEPAAWAFRHRLAMQRPHVWHRDEMVEANPARLRDALADLVDTPNRVVVCVPQSRQKHLLPYAEPGLVRVDDVSLTWTVDDVKRLGVYGTLRAAGFGETALAGRVPLWPALLKLPADHRAGVLDVWQMLDPWRDHHPGYLHVAAVATRKEKVPDAPTDDHGNGSADS